jgi:hypothetical protein
MFLSVTTTAWRKRNRLTGIAALALLLSGGIAADRAAAAPAPQPSASPAAMPAPAASPDAMPAPAASPTPAVTPGPTTGGRGGGVTTGVVHGHYGHLPIIDIVPIITFPQYYTVPGIKTNGQPSSNPLVNAGVGYDNLDVGGTFRLPITPGIYAAFDRVVEGTLNVPNARVTTSKNAYTYPAFSRDSVIVTRLDELPFKGLQVEEGLYFRHRIVGGTNTSNNPNPPTISSTEAHFAYAGITYATPGFRPLLGSYLTFNINGDAQNVDHHVGCTGSLFTSGNFTAPCVGGVFDPNPGQSRVLETDQYVQLTVPVDPKHGLTLTGQNRWGALNFYENAPFPYRWTTSQTYLLTKRFNRVFSLSLRAKDQWAVASGAPYVKPNSQHNGTIDILADFKVDTNTFAH